MARGGGSAGGVFELAVPLRYAHLALHKVKSVRATDKTNKILVSI